MSKVTHAATVVTADDGVSEIGSNEWNADHYQTIPDGAAQLETDHLALTTRLIAAGSGRLTVQEPVPYFKGAYGIGTTEICTDNYLLQYKEARLNGNARLSLFGNAECYLFDLAPVGRLVLAGRGG